MLSEFVADLHVHTVLSPCADYRMVPELIVERAAEAGLTLLAVTDHNSGENAAAVIQAARESSVAVLPGMEVECSEGVHVLTLFDEVERLERWQEIIYATLPERENVERAFGVQLVVGAEGDLIRVNRRLLITSAELPLSDVVTRSGQLGGVCIPAHVDRPAYGLLSVLGWVPDGLDIAALEISHRHTPSSALASFPQLAGRTLVRSSDAHTVDDIGKVSTRFYLAKASVAEIVLACRAEQGRRAVA